MDLIHWALVAIILLQGIFFAVWDRRKTRTTEEILAVKDYLIEESKLLLVEADVEIDRELKLRREAVSRYDRKAYQHRALQAYTEEAIVLLTKAVVNIKDKAFGYMPRMSRRNWANGFAIVHIDDNGEFHTNQVTVWNDSFFAEGRKY